jgi:hypothetical protein
MATPSTSSIEPAKSSSVSFLPLALAFGAGVVQLGSCGTPFVGVGVPVGLALSIAAIISGHVVLSRIKRQMARGRVAARIGLIAAYVSVLSIPIVGYGILLLFGGICGGGLFSR